MDIQWSLVLFTALTGMGGWLFFICLNVFVRKTGQGRVRRHGDGLGADRRRRPGYGHAPVPSRPHAGALQHPTSGHLHRSLAGGSAGHSHDRVSGHVQARHRRRSPQSSVSVVGMALGA